ncbi:MAG TPA: CocE/NonD family hydrolase [Acetobacteraceae bacterium]
MGPPVGKRPDVRLHPHGRDARRRPSHHRLASAGTARVHFWSSWSAPRTAAPKPAAARSPQQTVPPASRAELATYFAAHGYAVAYQDTRGRYGSEGRFVKYLSDGEDGFDACAWLRDQSWSDGRICTMDLRPRRPRSAASIRRDWSRRC